ncbi:MAG: hypothetical protein ACR2NA_14360 [Solirubrobacterales bacterium]
MGQGGHTSRGLRLAGGLPVLLFGLIALYGAYVLVIGFFGAVGADISFPLTIGDIDGVRWPDSAAAVIAIGAAALTWLWIAYMILRGGLRILRG